MISDDKRMAIIINLIFKKQQVKRSASPCRKSNLMPSYYRVSLYFL